MDILVGRVKNGVEGAPFGCVGLESHVEFGLVEGSGQFRVQ